jgi:DNA polymerase-4
MPQRTIFLVDMNAFFIACEMTRRPELRGGPAAVAGDPSRRTGIILAANYEARALGVRTAMTLNEALRLCPAIKLAPPDHDFYAAKSRQVMAILARFSPLVEQNSIDEAWLDMTGCEGLFGPPIVAAQQIMAAIESELDLWCSIGIADNKFLAKMASEMKKPRGITELRQENVAKLLWPLPVRAMYGVGAQTAAKLERLGVRTVGDLARLDRTYLIQTFGKAGETLHLHAQGLDDSPVTARSADDAKSIGREATLAHDVSDLHEAKRILLEQADEVGRRTRAQGLVGRTVQITLKYTDFSSSTRQMTVPPTDHSQAIYAAGCVLLDQNWDPAKPVRLLGITLAGLEKPAGGEQMSLFDLPAQPRGLAPIGCAALSGQSAQPGNPAPPRRPGALDVTIDALLKKHGRGTITRASLLKQPADETTRPSVDETARPAKDPAKPLIP